MSGSEHKPSQNERILSYMRDHGKITQRDALSLGCYRLGARIYDLKSKGYKILSTNKRVTNRDGTKSHVAEYKLLEG